MVKIHVRETSKGKVERKVLEISARRINGIESAALEVIRKYLSKEGQMPEEHKTYEQIKSYLRKEGYILSIRDIIKECNLLDSEFE